MLTYTYVHISICPCIHIYKYSQYITIKENKQYWIVTFRGALRNINNKDVRFEIVRLIIKKLKSLAPGICRVEKTGNHASTSHVERILLYVARWSAERFLTVTA